MKIREFFENRQAVPAKLEAFGFRETDGAYRYETPMLDGQFILIVTVFKDGTVSAQTIDPLSREEYVLHLVEGSVGNFVGSVRSEFEARLTEIRDRCFEKIRLGNAETEHVMAYILEKYQDSPEYLWEKTPEDAIWRRKDNGKWYGVLLTIPKRRLGLDSDEKTDILALRTDPEVLPALLSEQGFFPAYHMNKKHWFTVCLDGTVPTELLFGLIDKSYALALKK